MNITIKNEDQINDMRIGGQILAKALEMLKEAIVPGVSCLDLDNMFIKFLKENNCESNFKDYYGYPKHICVSINEQLIHAIPTNRILKAGDLVSIDAGLVYNKMNLDSAFTKVCSDYNNEEDKLLVESTEKSLYLAIEQIKAGVRIGTLSSTVQNYIEDLGFRLPTSYCGHGIGFDMHEDPQIPNVGTPNSGVRLVENMTICIEPMVQIGTDKTVVGKDKWTVSSLNGKQTAHFEHTILVTIDGYEILTKLK